MPHKKKRSEDIKVFVHEGIAYTPIHSDKHNAWIVEYNITKRFAGGGVKKVSKSFLDSQKITILASNK